MTYYIAVYGVSIGTKLYTISYNLYQFQKTLQNVKYVLSCSANLSMNCLNLKK